MKMKTETFLYVDPKLPAEQQEEIRRELEKKTKGATQVAQGEITQSIVNDFLGLFSEEQVKRLDDRIKKLKTIKGDNKFRNEIVALLMDVFVGALFSGESAKAAIAAIFAKYQIKLDE